MKQANASARAVADIVMDEVTAFSQLYNEPIEKAARRVFLGGMS